MGSQIIIAHRNARFLKAWFDTYRSNYKKDEWYTNAGHLPGKIIRDFPFIAHVEENRLGVFYAKYNLFRGYLKDWNTSFDAWHLLINHRNYRYVDNFKEFAEFNETIVWRHNVTFCHMAREVLTAIKEHVE